MDRKLLISASPGEWRAALLEDAVPIELFIERGDRDEVGSIHLGRVRRLVPALGAALVDIGGDRHAFLPQREVMPRGKRLDEGERVLVQILREAQGGKAARATTRAMLQGQFVELVAGRPGIRGGEALSAGDRAHLLAAIEAGTFPASGGRERPAKGGDEGLPRQTDIGVRVVESAPIDELATEAANLLRCWRDILDRSARLDPPVRLHPVATFAAALTRALPVPPRQILVDQHAAIPALRTAFPGSAVEHRPESKWPLDLDAVFDEVLSEAVAIPGGGFVHIEATQGAVMIDVDTGTPETGSPEHTGITVNFRAAETIARQIRLRNLGGGIVVDFVGLDSRALRERVRSAFAEALAPDPAQPQILGWTRLGHLELVRPRRARPLAEALLEPHPGGALVKTAITVAHGALRALRREARAQPGRNWRLIVAPDVAAALASDMVRPLQEVEDQLGRKITIEADPGGNRERFQIVAF